MKGVANFWSKPTISGVSPNFILANLSVKLAGEPPGYKWAPGLSISLLGSECGSIFMVLIFVHYVNLKVYMMQEKIKSELILNMFSGLLL